MRVDDERCYRRDYDMNHMRDIRFEWNSAILEVFPFISVFPLKDNWVNDANIFDLKYFLC